MIIVNSRPHVRLLLLGASLTLLWGRDECSNGDKCSIDEATKLDLSDFTFLLQTGSIVIPAPHNNLHKGGATEATTDAVPSSMVSSFASERISLVQTAYMAHPFKVQYPADTVSWSQEAWEHRGTSRAKSKVVDGQEMASSTIMNFAQDRKGHSPYRYRYTYNATSGNVSRSKVLADRPLKWSLVYVLTWSLVLLVLVVGSSQYLDTIGQKREKHAVDKDIPKVDSMLGSALTPRSSHGPDHGLARRSHKLSVGSTATGLLEDAETHTSTPDGDPYAGVGKGGNGWGCIGYAMLARFPGLHLLGGSALLLVVFPMWYPRFGLLLQMALISYGLLKFAMSGFWTALGLWKIRKQEQPGFLQDGRFESTDISSPAVGATDGCVYAGADGKILTVTNVLHCVVIPCYKEAATTVRATLHTLTEQTMANQIVVILAMEARDQEAEKTAQILTEQFQSSGLAAIFHTLHKLGSSEMPGKSSNENWAFRCCKRWLCDATGFPLEQILFTTCDADTYFHPQHFEYLSYLFLKSEKPHRSVWQGAVCALPNSYDLPALSSVRYIMLSLGYLGQLANEISPCGNFPLGVYSLSAKLAHEVGYWDPTVIPEDWHMFFRVNLESSSGHVRCVPMYTVVGNLGVEGSTYLESLKGCYKQSVRWQWGGISMGYLLMQLFQSKCPLWKKLVLILGHYEHHFFLPLVWLSAVSLPVVYNRSCIHLQPDIVQPTVVIHSSGCEKGSITAGEFGSLCWAFFLIGNWITVIVLEWCYRSAVQGRTHFERVPQGAPTFWRALMFLLFPITDLVFHVIPTWHAYLKMIFNTGFEYEVALKGASINEEEAKVSSKQAYHTAKNIDVNEAQSGRL